MTAPTQRNLDRINEVLAGCDAMQAYCVGVICALAWREGKQPSHAMLVLSASLSTVAEAFELWKRQTGGDDAE
jgi:hypothetical protein